jgi:uncharacterized Zn-binding protein involved in type VI secretion
MDRRSIVYYTSIDGGFPMPAAARQFDLCSCPAHVGGVILSPGVADVFICHQPVVRKGDKVLCLTGDVATIIEGCSDVIIGGQPVARKGDHTDHGGVILTGCPRVKICEKVRGICKANAAKRRAAFIRYTPRAPLNKLV